MVAVQVDAQHHAEGVQEHVQVLVEDSVRELVRMDALQPVVMHAEAAARERVTQRALKDVRTSARQHVQATAQRAVLLLVQQDVQGAAHHAAVPVSLDARDAQAARMHALLVHRVAEAARDVLHVRGAPAVVRVVLRAEDARDAAASAADRVNPDAQELVDHHVKVHAHLHVTIHALARVPQLHLQ